MIEVVKKRGIDKPRIVHNKKLFWTIIILGIILIALIISIVINSKNNNIPDNSPEKECQQDSDCAPVCGCHSNSCTPVINKTECERVLCTQDCSGPLDCGAGYCGCVNGKCRVISNE